MPQINVEFDEDTVRNLDRLAAKQSIRRTELLRRTVQELLTADAAGREPFTAPLQEIRAEEVAHLAREHRLLADELNRVLRANDKREKQLLAAFSEVAALKVAYEQDVAAARERGIKEAEALLEERLEPLTAELADQRAETARIAKVHRKHLEHALRLQQPPIRFEFGKHKLPVWWPLATLGLLGTMGFGLMILLSALLPDRLLSVPVADRMLGGRGFCILVDRRMGEGSCARWVQADRATVQQPLKSRAKR